VWTLLTTLLLALLFFISISGLIKYQLPFMCSEESKQERQRAWQRGKGDPKERLYAQIDEGTASRLRKLEEDEESREAEWTSGCEGHEEEGFERVEMAGSAVKTVRRRSTRRRRTGVKASECCFGCCTTKGATVVTVPTSVKNAKVEEEKVQEVAYQESGP
jgi:hypothetical protein